MTAIDNLRVLVQKSAAEMYQQADPKRDWQPGDMCYIKMKAVGDMDEVWHRGQIVQVADKVELKYNVKLRDIGQVAEAVPLSSLVTIDKNMERVSNSAVRCHLYNINPKNTEWPVEAIEFFKAQVLAYSSLHVSGYGREGDSLRVKLWGALTEISGPFSPAVTKYVDINNQLVSVGWAVKNFNLSQEMEDSIASHNTTTTLDASDTALKACLESVGRSSGIK